MSVPIVDLSYAQMADEVRALASRHPSLALAYTALVTPFEVSFLPIAVSPLDGLWLVNRFIDIVFIIDLLLNFRTAYYDDAGLLEERPRKIASNYLHGWFAFDFVK